jgi:hypothetical protein
MPDLPTPGFVQYRPPRPDPTTIVERATDLHAEEVMVEVGMP